jgi:hypothetical protein
MKEITIKSTKADREICYQRVLNNLIEFLPEDYPFWDDITNLESLVQRIDKANRNTSSQGLINWLRQCNNQVPGPQRLEC